MKRKLLILMMMCFVGWLTPLKAQETVLFSDDFSDGISSDDWRIFQGTASNYPWQWTEEYSQNACVGYGIVSWCYYSGTTLYPDNYIVTVNKYNITENTVLKYQVAATDGSYNQEYYSIVVSEDNSTWTNIFEEKHTIGCTEKSISLSNYVGKELYIGFRHYNCNGSNANGIYIDEVKLITSNSGGGETPPEPEPEPTPGIDLTKQYRVKVYNGNYAGEYLHVNSYNKSETNITSVITNSKIDIVNQIFTIESAGAANQYYLKSDGKYIKCNAENSWNVDAYSTTIKTSLQFEYATDGVFYIRDTEKSGNNYFQAQTSGVYCNASQNDANYWTLEEYESTPVDENTCAIVVEMGDSYGDGWNGDYLTYAIDGQEPESLEFNNGTSQTYTLYVTKGSTLVINYFGSNYYGENSLTIKYEDGDVLYTSNNPSAGTIVNVTVNCGEGGDTPTDPEPNPDGGVVVVPDGVGYEGAQANKIPSFSNASYSLSQQIYTAADLTAVGVGEDAVIKSIAFKANETINAPTRKFQVYLLNTDKTTFSSEEDFVSIPAANLCYEGEVTFAAHEWATMTLDTPFRWTNGNILVCVNDITGVDPGANQYYYCHTGDNCQSIAKMNYAQAYTSPDFTTGTYEEKYQPVDGSYKIKNQIQLSWTPWAGDEELRAEIIAENTELCDGDNENKFFLEAAKIANATYEWSVGGNVFANTREAVYSNANPGVYTITLTVTQDANTATATQDVVIKPLPSVDFEVDAIYVGEPMPFAITNPTEGASYEFTILDPDDVPYNIMSSSGEVTFDVPGVGTVQVTASLNGCTSTSAQQLFYIYPKAAFTYEGSCLGNATVFTNTTGDGNEFTWNFGDGTTVVNNDGTVEHTYTAAGTYTVTLTVDNYGLENTYTEQIMINAAPLAEFDYDNQLVLEEITFTATEVTNATYAWSFGDGATAATRVAKHIYDAVGAYEVTLTVTDNQGCETSVTRQINVLDKLSEPTITPENVDLGYRPVGAWMRPIDVAVSPNGSTPLTVESVVFEDFDGVGNFVVYSPELTESKTLQPGEELALQVTHDKDNTGYLDWGMSEGDGGMPTNDNLIINDEYVFTVNYHVYVPNMADVWELAEDVYESGDYTPVDNGLVYPNYLLPGADVTDYDAVYRIELDENTNLTVTSNGTNGHAYIYAEGFNGEGGPGLTNYIGYTPETPAVFNGFSFAFDDAAQGATQGDGWKTGTFDNTQNYMNADVDFETYNKYITSWQSYNAEQEQNYFITKDKYYLSETARIAMKTWIDNSNMKYAVFVSENGTDFVTVSEGVASSTSATDIDVALSQYAGGSYYLGVMHTGSESAYGSGAIYFDDITLYEASTRKDVAQNTVNRMLAPGVYYIVASAANEDFYVTINKETLELPERPIAISPAHMDRDVALSTELLKWKFGNYTAEYQVMFGTTQPFTDADILVDWTEKVAENETYEMPELEDNTLYYWQVNVRNLAGTTEGLVWNFATPFDAPQNLVVTPSEINVGETATATWEAVSNPSFVGYVVMADDNALNTTPIQNLSYVISGLAYQDAPYEITVNAVYNIGGVEVTAASEPAQLKVNGSGNVEGYVYEQDGVTPVEGATVTFQGAVFTTDANGYYSGVAAAGTYKASATKAPEFLAQEQNVTVAYNGTTEVNFTLRFAMTLAENVLATEIDNDNVKVTWDFDTEPMYEDFESGDLTNYSWTTSANYPWTVVDITPGASDLFINEEIFGTKCAKSGNTRHGNTESWLKLTVDIPFDGEMSFRYRVSCGNYGGSDQGKFFVDEEEHIFNQTLYDYYKAQCEGGNTSYCVDVKGCFGDTNWGDSTTLVKVNVTKGTHTFKWSYIKDYGDEITEDEDAMFIDCVTFYSGDNQYNVYVRELLSDSEPQLLQEKVAGKEYTDATWATAEDGIYQWGVSVLYDGGAPRNVVEASFDGGANAGETVTVGTEEINTYNFPTSIYSAYSYTQQLYTADEIASAAGKITSISFKQYSGIDITRKLDVYMTNVTDEYLASAVAVPEADKVFSGDVSLANGLFTINLNTHFNYTGGNLLLTINDVTGEVTGSDNYYSSYTYSDYDLNTGKVKAWCYEGSNKSDVGTPLVTTTPLNYKAYLQMTVSADAETEFTKSSDNWYVADQNGYGVDAYSGSSIFNESYANGTLDYLITPALDFSEDLTLSFMYIVPEWPDMPTDYELFRVCYSASPTGPWTALTDYNTAAVNDWTSMTVKLPIVNEVNYVAFEYVHVENYGHGFGLDNIVVTNNPLNGESRIAWSNKLAKGNKFFQDGNWETAANWSKGHAATQDEIAVIAAEAELASDASVRILFINEGEGNTLAIGETASLSVGEDVYNDEASSLVINAGGQFIHDKEGVVATFQTNIKAYPEEKSTDGWYTISSPLANDIDVTDVDNMLYGEFDLYRYDESTHYWENYEDLDDMEPGDPDNEDWGKNGGIIEKGRGYLYANASDVAVSFVGELNIDPVSRTLSSVSDKLTGFNLLGNPFTHNIYKGVAFANSGELIEGYYTLNNHGAWQVMTDDKPIKSGAGFLVQTENDNTTVNISKTNATRARSTNAMLAISVVNSRYEDVAYVSFKDATGLEKIGHMNEYVPMVYIPSEYENFAIATMEEDVTEIPVNFEAMTMGEYTFGVKAKNCEYKTMILVDKFTGTKTNLLLNDYTFMATTTDDPDRFIVKLALDQEMEDSFIYISNGDLVIENINGNAIINVFDVLGRNVATFNNCGDTTYRVSTDMFADGVYMVRLIEGANVKVQKVVIE